MNKENLIFVISVLKGVKIDCKPDWFSILGFLQYHRIAGLFYNKAKGLQICLPNKVERILENIYQSQENRTRCIRRYLGELSESLIKSQVKHILLKGSVLLNMNDVDIIYADGERTSNDIDILVNSTEISAASRVLKELGYVQGYYDSSKKEIVPFSRLEILKRRMNRGETAPFVRLTNISEVPFIEVDINFSLGNIPGEQELLLQKMIDSRNIYHGKVELCVSSPELFFLHLIMHQYKESELYFMVDRGKDLDLYKLVDIYYLWTKKFIKKEKLKELVDAYGLRREAGTVMGQVGRIFEDETMQSAFKEYANLVPHVVDYNTKKVYRWIANENIRLCTNDSLSLLEEMS